MKLSKEQEQVVTSKSKNIIVSAGAGSGKTTIIENRINYLVNELEVKPSNIVALTFTNLAAEELRSRVSAANCKSNEAFIGTIHSFANKMYKSSGVTYELLTKETEISYVSDLIHQYGKSLTVKKYLAFENLLSKVEKGQLPESKVSAFLSHSELFEYKELTSLKTTSKHYPKTLGKLCKEKNLITFSELLKVSSNYYKSINASIDYLLVDEFQDVGTQEYNFIKSLQAGSYFFVGDDWQSIYGFKGGNHKIFMKLMKNKTFTAYKLQDNYRNSKNVLDLSTYIIDQVRDKVEKTVVPKNINEGSVTVNSIVSLPYYLNMIKESGSYQE